MLFVHMFAITMYTIFYISIYVCIMNFVPQNFPGYSHTVLDFPYELSSSSWTSIFLTILKTLSSRRESTLG